MPHSLLKVGNIAEIFASAHYKAHHRPVCEQEDAVKCGDRVHVQFCSRGGLVVHRCRREEGVEDEVRRSPRDEWSGKLFQQTRRPQETQLNALMSRGKKAVP